MRFFVRNKLLTLIIVWVISLLGYEMYVDSAKWSLYRDTNTYLEIIKWVWFVNRESNKIGPLKISDWKVNLQSGDKVYTKWWVSMAVITWWDGSITRLWGNSTILINKNYIDEWLTQINIDFDLQKGKSWSNVVSTMWNNSYFNQRFETYVAWVRGTVYSVNLDTGVIYTADHEVAVTDTKNNKTTIVKEWSYFNINLFQEIHDAAQKKVFEALDAWWKKVNETYDNEYVKALREEVSAYIEKAKNMPNSLMAYVSDKADTLQNINLWKIDFENIKELSQDEIKSVYDKAYWRLQKINFVKSWDELFSEKLKLKEFLSKLDPKNNDLLMRTTTYDLQDAVESNDLDAISKITKTLSNADFNKEDLMKVFEQNFKDVLTNSSEIRDIMTHNLSWLEHFFSENFDRTINDTKKAIKSAEKGLNNLWEKAWELHNKAQNKVKWALNDLFQF